MASSLDVIIRYIGDASSATKAAKDTGTAYDNLAKNLQKTGLKLTAAVTLPLVAAGTAFMNELQNAEKVAAQTNAVIKSTGSAAGVTAKQVDQLGTSLMRKSGIDDEAIKSGENLLLTFTAVHNQAGKGNDIFNQATKAALNLSVAFGKDMSESSVLVGKALQDPIAGVTALQRVGVKLSDQQKESIKQFVESGDVMSAQKVILKELATQVGGSADAYGKTLAGQVSRAKEEVLNAGAAMVAVAAPALEKLAGAARAAADFFAGLSPTVQTAVASFAIFVAAVGPVMTAVGTLMRVGKLVGTAFEAIGSASETMQIQLMYAADAVRAFGVGATLGFGAIVVALGAFVTWTLLSKGATDDAAAAGKKWAEVQGENARAGATTARALSTLEAQQRIVTAALHDARDAQAAINQEQGGSAAQIKANADAYHELDIKIAGLQGKHDGLADAIKKATREQDLNERAARNQAAALDGVATAARGVIGATEDEITAVTSLNNATLAAQGGVIGYEAAQIRVKEAEANLAKVQGDSQSTTLDLEKANNDLAAAKLGVASAAYNMQASEAALQNMLNADGIPGLKVYRQSLVDAAAAHGDATGAVAAQITQVDLLIARAEADKTLKFNADTAKAKQDVDELNNKADNAARPRNMSFTAMPGGQAFERFHAGGVVSGPPGQERLAIVEAGETIIPRGHSTGSSRPGGGGGGSTFNITVKVEAGSNPAEIGAGVVDAIRSYERVAGSSWRAS